MLYWTESRKAWSTYSDCYKEIKDATKDVRGNNIDSLTINCLELQLFRTHIAMRLRYLNMFKHSK